MRDQAEVTLRTQACISQYWLFLQDKVGIIEEIKKAENEQLRIAVFQAIDKLPAEISREIRLSKLEEEEIIKNFSTFRNCVWFETDIMLPHPHHSSHSSSSFSHHSPGPSTTFYAQ